MLGALGAEAPGGQAAWWREEAGAGAAGVRGAGRGGVASGSSRRLIVPLPLFPSLSGQVNNATARVMTNKKTGNPYTNGKGLGTPTRLPGSLVGQRPWGSSGFWILGSPHPQGPSPGAAALLLVRSGWGRRGRRRAGGHSPHSWPRTISHRWSLAFPSMPGPQRPRVQASDTVGQQCLPGLGLTFPRALSLKASVLRPAAPTPGVSRGTGGLG